jgi:hypothetical protein
LPEQLCRELHPKEWGQIQGEERAGGVYWWLEHRHMWISQANLNIFTGFFKTGSLRKEENKTGCLVLFWVSPERSGPASLDEKDEKEEEGGEKLKWAGVIRKVALKK